MTQSNVINVGARLRALKQERYQLQLEGDQILSGASVTEAQRKRADAIAARLLAITKEHMELDELMEKDRNTVLPSEGGIVRPTGRTYREMFGANAASAEGWKSAEEFLTAIHTGAADPRLRLGHQGPMAAMNTSGNPSDGGFAVPTQFVAQWLDSSLEGEIVRPRAEVIPMRGSEAVAAGWQDETRNDGTTYGAFTGQWVKEGGEITVKVPKVRAMRLIAKKLALLAEVSIELAADGQGFEEQLEKAMKSAVGFFLDRAYLAGIGAGQPLGIINAGATVVVSKESGQSAATINLQNVLKMFARMAPASLPNSVWIANSTAIPQLLTTSIVVGDGGSFVPLLTQDSTGQFRMLTRPVIFTEKVPALGTKGDLIFADLSQYVIGLRMDASIDRSMHVGFTRGTQHYRVMLRGDGQPKLGTPITPANGDTVSPFVVLETRS